ncbi:MAG: zinc-binding dehydrogenase, partial [Christensenellaceae bacterium]
YVKVPFNNVFQIPDEVSFEAGAVAEPLACATYSVTRLDVKIGQTVVVFGCGTIGLMDVQLVRAAGAGKVIAVDIVDYNLEKALELGADFVFNTVDKNSKYYTNDIVESVKSVNRGRLAARAIVPTNAMPALQQALLVTGSRATIVYFGLPSPEDILQVSVLDFIQSDKTIKASWLSPLVWDNVFAAIASGQVVLDPLITHQFPLEKVVEGIKFMKESKDNKIKGIIRMKD